MSLSVRSPDEPVRVFISYCHADSQAHGEIARIVKSFGKKGLARTWDDRSILPGSLFWPVILTELHTADVIVLILSADYLKSKSCRREADVAIGRALAGQARVFPVKIDNSAITVQPLRDLQWIVPENKRWTNVKTEIGVILTEIAVGTPATRIFRPWGELSEEIARRIEQARQLWLGSTSGRGWFRDYSDEFTRMAGPKCLLFMNPRGKQFSTVLASKWRAAPAWKDKATWEEYRQGALELMCDLKMRPKVNLRVTDAALYASVLFIDPPFQLTGRTRIRLTPCPSSVPPVLFLELPAFTSYRTRPMARIFSFGEDSDFYRQCCETFAGQFASGKTL